MVRRVKSRSLKRSNNKSHKEVVPVSYRRHNYCLSAGWSSLVARRAHNPKVAGSNPAPATDQKLTAPRIAILQRCESHITHEMLLL